MRLPNLILTLSLIFTAASCGFDKQFKALANMTKCQYRIANLSGLQLAGVSIQGKSSLTQLSLTDAANLAQGYASDNLPLDMVVNMDVKNPTADQAAISRLRYILSLDGSKATEGTFSQGFSVAPGNTGTLPISLRFNLKEALSGRSKESLLNLAMTLAGQSSNPTKVGLKIKPSFNVGNQVLEYPSYFNVDTQFKSGKM